MDLDQWNFLTFHRDANRHSFFATSSRRQAFFDKRSGMWVVSDPLDCRRLIASAKLRTVSYGDDYRIIAERFGIDFSGLTFAFDHIPLCLHGERHGLVRRAAGAFLSSRREQISARLPELVARHLSALDRGGRIELMAEIVEPLVHDFTCLIAGLDGQRFGSFSRTSQIFDRSSGLPKRQAIEAEVLALRRLVEEQLGIEATEFDVGLRVAFFILGKDPLKGTLGESLRHLFDGNGPHLLTEMAFPAFPPETGVPFIERIVVEPFELDGHALNANDRVRLLLQSFAYEPAQSHTNFFGAGAHACLGRPLSLEMWTALTAHMATLPICVTLVSSTPRMSDYVFTCPEQLVVEVTR